jgi:hypothetical protein
MRGGFAKSLGFPCSTVGGDLMGSCQPNQRGKLRLKMSLGILEDMIPSEVRLSYFIIEIIPPWSNFDFVAF